MENEKSVKRVLSVAVVGACALGSSLAVGLLLDWLSSAPLKSTSCSELAMIGCAASYLVLLIVSTVITQLVIGWLLLKRIGVNHRWAIAWCGLLISYALQMPMDFNRINVVVVIIASLLLNGLLYVLFDWLFNARFLKRWPIVLISLVALAFSYYVTTQLKSPLHDFANKIDSGPFTVLAPPLDYVYQPYAIDSSGTATGYDLSQGANISLTAGPQKGFNLYEYKYIGPVDPLQDCSHLYDNDHSDQIDNCQLVKTLPSGLRIYSIVDYVDELFVIKNGTIAFLATPVDVLSDEEKYNLLDSLRPTTGEALRQTLHKQNPEQF